MAVAYGAQRGRGRCANLCVAVVQQRDQRVHAVVAADLATDLHGNRAGNVRTEIDPELGARGIVERRRKANVRIAIGTLVVVDRGRLARDLHVALDAITLIVGDELERIGAERKELLRQATERDGRLTELSRRDHEEKLATLQEEANEAATPEPIEVATPLGKRRSQFISKQQRDASFSKQMSVVQAELSPVEKTFSKVIHNKTIETISDWSAASIARPNALLSASIVAFFLTGALYVFAKYIGFRLSGFEIIGTFALGWGLGLLYDYFKLTANGGKK